MVTNHRNMSMLVIISIVIGLVGCGKGPLTEAQSEIAGYCVTYFAALLGPNTSMESFQLGLIQRHIEERGFKEKGFEDGVLRAGREYENKKLALNDRQTSECQQVLNW